MQRVETTVPRSRGIRAASGPSTPDWRPHGATPGEPRAKEPRAKEPRAEEPLGSGHVGAALAQPYVSAGEESRTAGRRAGQWPLHPPAAALTSVALGVRSRCGAQRVGGVCRVRGGSLLRCWHRSLRRRRHRHRFRSLAGPSWATVMP